MKISAKKRAELKRLITLNTNFAAETLQISAQGGVSAKLDPNRVLGLTKAQRRFRGFIGHYPEILRHWA